MRLIAPSQGLDFRARDIYGKQFQLSSMIGKRVMLSFFRDAACPFCNYRIYELTQKHKEWQEVGVEIVVVFSDTNEKVLASVAKRPRPFTMICDPELKLYNLYGVETSSLALFKAFVFDLGEIIRGLRKGARPTRNPHMTLVPADFLIDLDGQILDLWYGKTTADHIPFSRLIKFGSKEDIKTSKQLVKELKKLRKENLELKRSRPEK